MLKDEDKEEGTDGLLLIHISQILLLSEGKNEVVLLNNLIILQANW